MKTEVAIFFSDSQFILLDSGKTALAATVGIDSDFPYVKIVGSCSSIELTILFRN